MSETARAEGDISHRAIWRIAAPAILANSAAPLVGLVDTAVIGHMPSPDHLAAVGIGATFFSFLFWAFGFLRMGTTGLVAQASGAGDTERVAREQARAFTLGLTIGLVTILAMGPLITLGLSALSPPESVAPLAEGYLGIRIWSAPATLIGYAITGTLIGLGRTDRVLLLQIFLNLLNLGLNLLFVLGLDMGVKGLALGSVIAESATMLLGLIMLARLFGLKALIKGFQDSRTWQVSKMRRLLMVNGFIFVRTLMLIFVFSYLTRKAALMGPVELASAQVLLTFSMLISLGLDGVAYAAETMTGQATGAHDRPRFDMVTRRTFMWAYGVAALYALLFGVLGTQIVSLLTDIEAVRATLHPLLPLVAAMPLIAVASYQYDGIYIGATAAAAMAGTMAVSSAAYFGFVDWAVESWGLAGLWGMLLAFLALRGITQALWYRRVAPPKSA